MTKYCDSKWFNIIIWLCSKSLLILLIKKFKIKKKDDHIVINAGVVISLILAFVFVLVSNGPQVQWWEWIFIGFAICRISSIIIYQIWVLFLPCYFKIIKKYSITSVPRLIILLLINYLEILFFFALFYRNFTDFFTVNNNFSLNSISGSSYFSLVTMTTLGYGDVTPTQWQGMFIISIQTLIGLFMALLIIARSISHLPKHKTEQQIKDELKEMPMWDENDKYM